ncbi:hypothetical protein SASPL_139276 [Salvia splendens]|uniref:Uncharacterized protein n=1 Tax=Salvia splendens TaxID=180675 RepID=A0A8X8ZAU7_SALSN|nr:vascular-related unknown protein 4-like isoform X2 [Salvia splendens]KAG6397828.1 hypothetical protein SASPL_139276 [Salvia splendens]
MCVVFFDNKKMGDSPEESSWTFYIEGFVCEDNINKPCLSSDFESPSLVSDAASSAVAHKFRQGLGFSSPTLQNSFKKQKTNIIPAMDYDLEDTASSPVNSPKVSYMNEFMNHGNKKEKGKRDVSDQAKRNNFGKVFAVERDSELKKKSTCD